MEYKFIISTTKDRSATITFNRPDSINTLNLQMAEEFLDAFQHAANDDSVRVIIIRGSGRAFSAGGDVKEMYTNVTDGNDPAAYFREPLKAFGKMISIIRSCPKPVLAVVQGAVMGFSLNLMLACDLVLAESETRFGEAFIGLGLSPDGGGTWTLPRIIGYARACELMFLPEIFDAQKALEMGLINRVIPGIYLENQADELVKRLESAPSKAIARTKWLLNQSYHTTLEAHIELERLAQIENAHHPNFKEGLSAFLEKRKPEFS